MAAHDLGDAGFLLDGGLGAKLFFLALGQLRQPGERVIAGEHPGLCGGRLLRDCGFRFRRFRDFRLWLRLGFGFRLGGFLGGLAAHDLGDAGFLLDGGFGTEFILLAHGQPL